MCGIEALESRRLFNAGGIDSSYGTHGSTTTTLGTVNALASGQIVAQKDGKLLAVGYGSNNGVGEADLLRFNADGTPDTTFGTAGKIAIESGANLVKDVVVAPDGSIYVAMNNANSTPPPLYTSEIFHYTPTGQLDTKFGSAGELTLAPYVTLASMAVRKNGSLVVVSAKETNPGGISVFGIDPTEIVLQQFNTDGTPDSNFGSNGETGAQLGSEDFPKSILVQRDGRTIVAGIVSDGTIGSATALVARFNANGTLDTSYGNKGMFTNSAYTPDSAALTPGGKVIFTSRTADNQVVLARLTARGQLDNTFGTKGIRLLQTDAQLVNTSTSAVVEPSGKILVGTEDTLADIGSQTVLTRFNPNGTVDKHFGKSGNVAVSFTDPGAATAVAESGGRILVAEDINIGTVNTVKELVLVAYRK